MYGKIMCTADFPSANGLIQEYGGSRLSLRIKVLGSSRRSGTEQAASNLLKRSPAREPPTDREQTWVRIARGTLPYRVTSLMRNRHPV